MRFLNGIHGFPSYIRLFIFLFTLSLTFGYFIGFKLVSNTTKLNPSGVEQNYLGNEEDEQAEQMMFKKSEREILVTIHNHVISFSMIFFGIGIILLTIPFNQKLKNFLLIEPFVSIIITFGGIYLLWKGFSFLKYVIIISGSLITIAFVFAVFIIFFNLLIRQKVDPPDRTVFKQ